jgi:hypothetical protein
MTFSFSADQITHHFEDIDPQTARALLDGTLYDRQRQVDPTSVQEYKLAIQRGEFRPASQLDIATVKDKHYLINGQRSLQAVSLAGKPHRFSVLTYACADIEQVHMLYGTYDRNRPRRLAQLYETSRFCEKHNLSVKQAKMLGAAMPLLAAGFASLAYAKSRRLVRGLLHSVPIRFSMMEDWLPEMRLLVKDIAGAPHIPTNVLMRAGALPVILVTYRYAPDEAHEFWHNVAWNRADVGDPRRVLVKWCDVNMLVRYHPHVLARYMAIAWNAAMDRRKLNVIALRGASAPIIIKHTPHDGLRHLSVFGEYRCGLPHASVGHARANQCVLGHDDARGAPSASLKGGAPLPVGALSAWVYHA